MNMFHISSRAMLFIFVLIKILRERVHNFFKRLRLELIQSSYIKDNKLAKWKMGFDAVKKNGVMPGDRT